MLIISIMSIYIGTISAEQKKEDMDKSIGNKWEYRYTSISENATMVFTMSMDITGETVVEIDGNNYDVFEAVLDGKIESYTMPETPGATLTLVEDSGLVDGTAYVTKNTFDETAKLIQNMKFIVHYEELNLDLNSDITQEITSTVASGEVPDIIDVGSSWVLTIQKETTTTTTVYGSFYDTYMGQGYTNTTTSNESDIETTNYECLGKKTITTPAGIFETYEIKRSHIKLGEEIYSIFYTSDVVKDMVKSIDYNSDGSIIGTMELTSYDLDSGLPSQDKTPGFELVLVGCAITLLLFMKRRKI